MWCWLTASLTKHTRLESCLESCWAIQHHSDFHSVFPIQTWGSCFLSNSYLCWEIVQQDILFKDRSLLWKCSILCHHIQLAKLINQPALHQKEVIFRFNHLVLDNQLMCSSQRRLSYCHFLVACSSVCKAQVSWGFSDKLLHVFCCCPCSVVFMPSCWWGFIDAVSAILRRCDLPANFQILCSI